MAKGSQRRPVHCEKDQSGCMWGLISIFDFRQVHSSRKFLSDRRRGSNRHALGTRYSRSRLKLLTDFDEKCQGNDDGDEIKTLTVDIGKTSVKELMEDEMSGEPYPKKQIPGTAVEQMRSDLEHGGHFGKNRKQTNKTCKVACDIHVHDSDASTSLESLESYHPNSLEQYSHNLNLAALVEEFCSQIHQQQEIHMHHENGGDSCDAQKINSSVKHNQLDELDMHLVQKHSILQEKLSEATEAFINQKLISAKQLTRDGANHKSKQFTDALEILNSNKELFLKLLQDPNSLLVKNIQGLQNAQSEKVKPDKSLTGTKLSEEEIGNSRQCEELVCRKQLRKQRMHNLFRRKVKTQSRTPSKGSDSPQASNRIVVLKPRPASIQNSETATIPSYSPQAHYDLRNQGQSGRVNSHFSLREIKRKLLHVMGESRKEQPWISMDGNIHRIPYNCQDSGDDGKVIAGKIAGRELPSKTYFHIERTAKPSANGKREDKISKPTNCLPSSEYEVSSTSADSCKNLTMTTAGYPEQRKSNIYIEAKKHLAEMLTTGDEDGDFSSKQDPRTLGRLLSLPEYNLSPIVSPRRDRDPSFVTAQMRFSPYDNFRIVSENVWRLKQENTANCLSPLRQNLETTAQTDGNNPEIKLQVLESNPDTSEELVPDIKMQDSIGYFREDLSSKGGEEIVEITDAVCKEESNLLNGPSEPKSGTPITNGLRLDSPRENQPLSSSLASYSPISLVIQKDKVLESINDGPERPSPVSVLEPFFLEDVISPSSTIPLPAELPMQPLRLHFEEYDSSTLVVTPSDPEIYLRTCMEDKKPTFEYVRAVLQASGLNWDEFFGKYHFSDQPLDPSLFDEVEVLSGQQLCDDQKLLFDCINEVLVEVYERCFGCSPWVAFVKPNIRPVPMGKKIITEVWEGIEWHLLPQFPPRTLDQIVGKDMAKAGTWMDVRVDTEDIGIEMGETILEELMEETILDLHT